MDVSIAEARKRFTQLIRAVEQGESVVITRNGKPVAQIAPAPPSENDRSASEPWPVASIGNPAGTILSTWTAFYPVSSERLPARHPHSHSGPGKPRPPSGNLKAAIQTGPAHLSVISYWEVMIKSKTGKLEVGDPRSWWREALEALALRPLLYRPDHVSAQYDLTPIHNDPFDRGLMCQASAEDLTFVTTDKTVALYASEQLKILS